MKRGLILLISSVIVLILDAIFVGFYDKIRTTGFNPAALMIVILFISLCGISGGFAVIIGGLK